MVSRRDKCGNGAVFPKEWTARQELKMSDWMRPHRGAAQDMRSGWKWLLLVLERTARQGRRRDGHEANKYEGCDQRIFLQTGAATATVSVTPCCSAARILADGSPYQGRHACLHAVQRRASSTTSTSTTHKRVHADPAPPPPPLQIARMAGCLEDALSR